MFCSLRTRLPAVPACLQQAGAQEKHSELPRTRIAAVDGCINLNAQQFRAAVRIRCHFDAADHACNKQMHLLAAVVHGIQNKESSSSQRQMLMQAPKVSQSGCIPLNLHSDARSRPQLHTGKAGGT